MKLELKEPECGVGCCKPKVLKGFASINWFTAVYSCTGIVVSSLSMYIVSQITTIEKQFGLNSGQTGYLLACNDIGYSFMILIASHFATKVHIPRVLCVSAMFYGISGIICSIPHFMYNYETPTSNGGLMKNFTLTTQLKLCTNISSKIPSTANSSEQLLNSNSQEKQSIADVRSAAMAFIAIGMIFQGFGKAPRFPMLAQYLDDNTNKRNTGFYMGKSFHVILYLL